jgi:hypothetical protein
MAYTPIDQDLYGSDLINGTGLHAGLSVKQAENAKHLLNNRLKRHTITYANLGISRPGSRTALMIGTLGYPKNLKTTNDANNIGLQFSTPASEVLCLPPIPWPTSSTARKFRFTLMMRALNAPVEVYAFCKNRWGTWGLDIAGAGYINEDGQFEFNETAKAGSNYIEVGTSNPAVLYHCPVTLELDISPPGQDQGIHRPYDIASPSEIFFCFRSTQGSLSATVKSAVDAVPSGYGTSLQLQPASTWDALVGSTESVGTWHRWIKFTNVQGFSSSLPVPANQAWRHVLQIRPDDPDDLTTGGAHVVLWPPIRPQTMWDLNNTDLEIYECGVTSLASICIEELAE